MCYFESFSEGFLRGDLQYGDVGLLRAAACDGSAADGSGLACTHGHHVFRQQVIMVFIWSVQQDEHQIKPGQQCTAHSTADQGNMFLY